MRVEDLIVETKKNKGIPLGEIRRIVVREVNWCLGDTLMTTPVFAALREAFPQAYITAIVPPDTRRILQGNPNIDEFIIFDHRGRHRNPLSKLRFALELRRKRFDLAILLQRAFEAALLATIAGIPYRVGYDSDRRGRLLTTLLRERNIGHQHQVETFLDLIRAITRREPSDKRMSIYITKEDRILGEELLRESGIERGDVLVGLNPGARQGGAKRWFPQRFAKLADEIAGKYNVRVVILGDSHDVEIAREVIRNTSYPVVDLSGRTTLGMLAYIIKRCSIFITNDTGGMHVASAVGTPIVAIIGPTDPVVTGPRGPQDVIVRKDGIDCAPCIYEAECKRERHYCMEAIAVDDVEKAASRILDGIRLMRMKR
ncbi:MAG: lipopolysaccharide heptosyltransferase II [bacterium]